MIRLVLMRDIFGSRPVELEVPWREGLTIAELLRDHALPSYGEHTRLAVSSRGKRLGQDELGMPIADDLEVVAAPDPTGLDPVTILLIASLVVSLLSIGYQLLVGTPEPPGKARERGDNRSATYAWDQIQSEYRPGFPVPLVFGEHDVGGQVIYTDVTAKQAVAGGGYQENLAQIVALSEGRIQAVGGISGGARGEFNGARGLAGPSNVRLNGNLLDQASSSTGIYLRMGEVAQTPLPSVDFPGTASVQLVGEELADAGDSATATISDAKDISTLRVTLSFPAGLYFQAANGALQQYPTSGAGVQFVMQWRLQGASAWSPGAFWNVAEPATQSAFALTEVFDITSGGVAPTGPLEVQVTRNTPQGGQYAVSQSTWRQLGYTVALEFSYARTALFGAELLANAQNATGRPQWLLRVKGLRVHVWDAALGLSAATYWEVPEAGDPYGSIWSYPPGQNPAWILGRFLTHTAALGEFVGTTRVDWAALRNWADFCDQDHLVGGVNEALCQCDLVIDSPKDAWSYIMQICQAGRASPVMRGNEISVVYQYSAAHGRGTNSVPQKAATQLISTTNVTDFSVQYLDTRARPGVITAQFLNRDIDYAQDARDIEDPAAEFNKPSAINPLGYVKESVQFYGVTRESQIEREVLFMHAVNRAVKSQVSFRIGPEALAAQAGDLIEVQHDVLRPFTSEAFAYRFNETTNTTSVKLDRPITISPAISYQFVLRDATQVLRYVNITQTSGTYAAGTAINIDSTISVAKGDPLTFGRLSAVVSTYEITRISLDQNLERQVTAVTWDSSSHTTAAQAAAPSSDAHTSTDYWLRNDNSAAVATSLRASRLPEGSSRYRISWEIPEGYSSSHARVFLTLGADLPQIALDQVAGTSVDVDLVPARQYVATVALTDQVGVLQLPDQAATLTFTADEFPAVPVPGVRNGSATALDGGVLLEWEAVDQPTLAYYEVRRGPRWLGAPVLARVENPRAELPLAGSTPTNDAGQFVVRARATHGLYSSELAIDGSSLATLANRTMLVDSQMDLQADGDRDGVSWDTDALELDAGVSFGTFVSDEVSLGYDAHVGVTLLWLSHGIDDAYTVDDATFAVDSGESWWRVVDGREASPASPGINIEETVDDFTGTVDDADGSRLVAGYIGEPGVEHAVRVLVRYALDAEAIASQSWEPYRPAWRTLGRVQFRFEFYRAQPALGNVRLSSASVRLIV